MVKHIKTIVLLLIVPLLTMAQTRWNVESESSIVWNIDNKNIPHYDHIEMSGLKMSSVLRYGVNPNGSFQLERSMVWPMLRTLPNNTHASLMQRFAIDYPSLLLVNGLTLNNEKVKQIKLDGRLSVVSDFCTGYVNTGAARKRTPVPVVEVTRSFFPSPDKPMLCEQYTVKNITSKPITVVVPTHHNEYKTDPVKGKDGSYTIVTSIQKEDSKLYQLQPGEEIKFHATVQAYKKGENEIQANVAQEQEARLKYINEVTSNLEFISPDKTLNTAFSFAKVRASESIYETAGGLMHGPGGESYYAAIWANDQAEYVNPFFPFLGYATGNESAYNSFKHFARFMNPEYKAIPSSIIAEGTDIWAGVGDRGDAAMVAYGASRYALANADINEAKELWPLIEWCLEYSKRNLNAQGVVNSNTDELEGRFPSGDANLCTSSLYYDALLTSSYLAKELGKNAQAKQYKKQADALKKAINSYFGATVEGFDTYQYYDGNDILRSWICIPLTVNIYDKKEGTIDALFSPRLWTKDGLLTQAGTETFWDRSTLYALRGVYAAGARERATEYMKHYSQQRLLGDHVPYPIEAWPEGSQRHLSAESGLYCRIVTEGIFGIRPTGFKTFDLTPQLPNGWDNMELKNIRAFDSKPFNISISRVNGDNIKITIERDSKVIKTINSKNGETKAIKL